MRSDRRYLVFVVLFLLSTTTAVVLGWYAWTLRATLLEYTGHAGPAAARIVARDFDLTGTYPVSVIVPAGDWGGSIETTSSLLRLFRRSGSFALDGFVRPAGVEIEELIVHVSLRDRIGGLYERDYTVVAPGDAPLVPGDVKPIRVFMYRDRPWARLPEEPTVELSVRHVVSTAASADYPPIERPAVEWMTGRADGFDVAAEVRSERRDERSVPGRPAETGTADRVDVVFINTGDRHIRELTVELRWVDLERPAASPIEGAGIETGDGGVASVRRTIIHRDGPGLPPGDRTPSRFYVALAGATPESIRRQVRVLSYE